MKAAVITCTLLIAGQVLAAYPPPETLVREPAIVVSVDSRNETVTIRFPKSPKEKSPHDYKPILSAGDCKVFFIYPTNRRRNASVAALKPEMDVLVSGSWNRWVPYATEIRVPQK